MREVHCNLQIIRENEVPDNLKVDFFYNFSFFPFYCLYLHRPLPNSRFRES